MRLSDGIAREEEDVFEITIWNNELKFETAPSLFSPSYADKGTLHMLDTVELGDEEKVLDLGCGYGLVGVAIAKEIGEDRVTMIDNDPLAVEYAKGNLKLNDVEGVHIACGEGLFATHDSGFSLILSNPPYHEDFSTAKRFIEGSFQRLRVGGRLKMVVKRLKWYKNKMRSVFGGVTVRSIDEYFVLTSYKRSDRKPEKPKKPVKRKHAKKMAKNGKKDEVM